MRRRLIGCALGGLAVLAAGCGGSSFHHARRGELPLVPGSSVVGWHDDPPVDTGASRNYLLTLIVVGPRGSTSSSFKSQQFARLLAAGWRRSAPHFSIELAASQPSRKISATIATLHDAEAEQGYIPEELSRAVHKARGSGRPGLVVELLPTY